MIIGDESSLPAIARILEATYAPETRVFIEIADAAEKQDLTGAVTWIERRGEVPGRGCSRRWRPPSFPK